MAEKADKNDLQAHKTTAWQSVHGIWAGIMEATSVKSKAKFRAYVSSAQDNLGNNVYTKLALNAETYDIGSNYDHATNYRFTAPEAGFYLFVAGSEWSARSANDSYEIAFYKNDSAVTVKRYSTNAEGDHASATIQDILQLAAGDYIEVWVRSNNNATSDIQTGSSYSYFAGHILSKT